MDHTATPGIARYARRAKDRKRAGAYPCCHACRTGADIAAFLLLAAYAGICLFRFFRLRRACAAPAPSFARPVPGQTLQAFSGDELIYSETLGDWRTHNGADLAANAGDTVQCAAAGEVVTAQEDARWGGVVEVSCGDVTVRYAGLALPLTVSEGQQLAAGQAVGQVGRSCESAQASHLHLEVLQEDSYLDPIAWMEQAG